METAETGMQAYTDVVMNAAFLDWKMQCLQTQIKCKNEENLKLENKISDHKKNLEKLQKNIRLDFEREEKLKNNINMLRNSRTITEGLLMSMKHQLHIHEEKRSQTKNTRNNILQKYSTLFESYSKIYSSLPWIQKTTELQLTVERKRIQLDILKLKYSSFKKKILLFCKIEGQRIRVAIIKLANDFVTRNNLLKEIEVVFNQQKELESKIINLEEEKKKLQETINLKVKEAVVEARERVLKAQVGGSSGEKVLMNVNAAPTLVIPAMSDAVKTRSESIFSRLGLSAPHTLKRPTTMRSRIPEKLLCLPQESKKIEISVVEKVNAIEEKKKQTIDSNSKEILLPALEPERVNKPTLLTIKDKNGIPAKKTIKKKKKIKKKIKKNQKKKIKSINVVPENLNEGLPVNNKGIEEEPSNEKTDEEITLPAARETLRAETTAGISHTIPDQPEPENTINPEKAVISTKYSEEINNDIISPNDPDMNNSNLSLMDNVSFISSTYTNENRYQMDGSPDFLTRPPGGYCFSPIDSPSKKDNGSVKDASPSYEFPGDPFTALFPMETQKVTAGTSSDFSSFFATSTPKKSAQSTKSFFQMFG